MTPFGIGDFIASFKGDTPGHPFRGNQYEGSTGGTGEVSGASIKHYENTTAGRNQKINDLKEGSKVLMGGKEYSIYGIKKIGGAKNRTDMNLLEKGKEPKYSVPGRALNAGKMIEMSNLQFHTFYNDKGQYSIDRLDVLE